MLPPVPAPALSDPASTSIYAPVVLPPPGESTRPATCSPAVPTASPVAPESASMGSVAAAPGSFAPMDIEPRHAPARRIPPAPPSPAHPCNGPVQSSPRQPRTHLQDNIRKPKQYTDGTVRYGLLTQTLEPTSLHDALTSPNWKHAMDLEFDALMKNHTWHLVAPQPSQDVIDCKWVAPQPGQDVIDCKWVYKVKQKADGTIDRYKARLVAKGFKQ